MADELDKKIKQIADMFGVSDTNSLKNIVENIAQPDSGTASNTSTSANASTAAPSESNASGMESNSASYPNNRSSSADLGMLSKMTEMVNMLNNIQDSRITLLNSVQPFLGNQRQQRLGGAIQLLRIIAAVNSIAPAINHNTKR